MAVADGGETRAAWTEMSCCAKTSETQKNLPLTQRYNRPTRPGLFPNMARSNNRQNCFLAETGTASLDSETPRTALTRAVISVRVEGSPSCLDHASLGFSRYPVLGCPGPAIGGGEFCFRSFFGYVNWGQTACLNGGI